MPNHVINQITAPAEVIAALGNPVDFERIVPWPKGFQWSFDGVGIGCYVAQAIFKRDLATAVAWMPKQPWRDEDFEQLIVGLQNAKACGHADILDLQCAIWGTKWNAYSFEAVSDTSVRFQTAWDAPIPVIEALSQAYPEAEILHDYADENIGSNCDALLWKNGTSAARIVLTDTRDFATRLWRRKHESTPV